MQRVGIDVRMARHSGVGRYIRGTLSGFSDQAQQFHYVLVGSQDVANDFDGFDFKVVRAPIYSLSEQIQISLAPKGCECLHVPHYNAPIFWKKKLVITIHDLIHLHFPEYLSSRAARFYARFMLPALVQRADAIISVSEYTKKDLVENLDADPRKITVIHHGVDPIFLCREKFVPQAEAVKPPEADNRYFLYVGLLKAHKNVGLLLAAFKHLTKALDHRNIKLFLIGQADQKQGLVRKWLEEIKSDPNVIHKQDIDDVELRSLYQNAVALILPSLFEGFGFPLLEAMACGTAIIASDAASIPEVAGEAAMYFDPRSERELAECMRQLLTNGSLRERLILHGHHRLQIFDWKQSAQKTIRVYETVLGTDE